MEIKHFKIVLLLIQLLWIGAMPQVIAAQTPNTLSPKREVSLSWNAASERVVFAPSTGGTW